MTSKREQNKQNTSQLILETATALFIEHGYDNVSMADIASACGISRATLFNYVKRKEYILLLFVRSQKDHTVAFDETLAHDVSAYDAVRALLLEDLSMLLESRECGKLVRSCMSRFEWLAKKEVKNRRELARIFERRIEQGREAGEVRADVPVCVVTRSLMALYFYTLENGLLLELTGNEIEQQVLEGLDCLWQGVAALPLSS